MTEQELYEMNDHIYSDVEKAIRETRIEWYKRGLRDGREEVKAALRELLGFGFVTTDGNGITLPTDTLKG